MKVYRIHISSWMASFRYPNLISGFQPTLPVPPLSTINGLISAALGRCYAPEKPEQGYIFQALGKAVDLETIYQVKKLKEVKSNVIRREFLFDTNLWLYTQNTQVVEAFQRPYFPLLLGRSGDLASVNSILEVEVDAREQLSNLKGTIVPFGKYRLAAPIQALPAYFTDTFPRRNVCTKPYYLLEGNSRSHPAIAAKGFSDPLLNRELKTETEIYWQE